MKKSVKTLLCAGAAFGIFLGSSMTSLAGTWRQGTVPNENHWWYDFDNGAYAKEGWQWIDGNNDGIEECYYFDKDGWLLVNTTTPDNFTVNADGAWTQDGTVQTKGAAQSAQTQQTTGDPRWMWIAGADGTMTQNFDLQRADFRDWITYMETSSYDLPREARVAGWAQASERGAAWKALFDKYEIPYNLLDDLSFSNREKTVTYTTPAGMTIDDLYCAGPALEMMFWLASDGMAGMTCISDLNEDGSVTIVAQVSLMG